MTSYDYMNLSEREDWKDCVRRGHSFSAGRIAWMAENAHNKNIAEGTECHCGVCKPNCMCKFCYSHL